MSYTAQLQAHYAAVRERLIGKPRPVMYRPPKSDWQQIVSDVSRKHLIPVNDLMRKGGNVYVRKARYARWECWYMIRTRIFVGGKPVSYDRIGSWFDRDHSTVIHGVQKYCAEKGLPFPK